MPVNRDFTTRSMLQIKKWNTFIFFEVLDKDLKSKVCHMILENLPGWFGIAEANARYKFEVKEQIFISVEFNHKPVGFISINDHNLYTSEVHVMGVDINYHRQGLGRELVDLAVDRVTESVDKKFLMVKTLSDRDSDPYYKKTRAFYTKVGFYPLAELIEIWGESNPCLVMIKPL